MVQALLSRSPSTGEKEMFAEYLPNAQGEDVVAGIRTPLHIDWLEENYPPSTNNSLKQFF